MSSAERVDETDPLGCRCLDPLARPAKLERLGRANEPGQDVGTAPVGHQPYPTEDLAKPRTVSADAEVAGEGEIAAATSRHTVYRRNDRGTRRAHHARDASSDFDHENRIVQAVFLEARVQVLEIGSGTEAAARTGDHHSAYLRILQERREGPFHLVRHRPVEGIEYLGPIEREHGDAIGVLDRDRLEGGAGHTRSTIIAMPWPTPMHIVTSPKRPAERRRA
jgi:hypothetical protein